MQNFNKAFAQLTKFVDKSETLNELEQQGLIKAFEYTYELAWNAMKDFYEDQGEANIQGSRDAFRLAHRRGLIDNGQDWMDMVKDRQITVHTYNQETSDKIANHILNVYYHCFKELANKLNAIKDQLHG